MSNNNQGVIISNGNVSDSNNHNKNQINQAGMNIRKIQFVSGAIGFILGILSSFIASVIYGMVVD